MNDDPLDANRIAAEVITELAKTMASKLFGSIPKHLKDCMTKSEIDLGYAFIQYLNHAKKRCEKIKTLLYRNEPKELYSFYECAGVTYKKRTIDTSNLNNVLDISHNIIITGTGGIGKTIMMKHFFLNCIYHKAYIPVLVELRGLNESNIDTISIFDFVYEKMEEMDFQLEKNYFEYALKKGHFLILFDGYDEVVETLCNKVTKQIIAMTNKYSHSCFIVSSRPSDEFVGWSNFVELPTKCFSKEQALSLISKFEYDEAIKKNFYEQLESKLFEKHETFATNPLLLTIMFITFASSASMPDNLNDFYEQAFTSLLNGHDATKDAYTRINASKLSNHDFKKVFSHFCFRSFFKSKYEFSESQAIEYIEQAKSKVETSSFFDSSNFLIDLTDSVCMLIKEGFTYRFTHRSFQEYFTSVYIFTLDDDSQKEILEYWAKKTQGFERSTFLNMLNAMSRDRFFKNFLKPGLVELNDFFLNNELSYKDILKLLLESIAFNKKDDSYKIAGAVLRENYYWSLIGLTCQIYGYDRKSALSIPFNDKYNIVKNLNFNQTSDMEIKMTLAYSWDELEQRGILVNIIEENYWPISEIKFALDVLHQYQKDIIQSKELNSESIFEKY